METNEERRTHSLGTGTGVLGAIFIIWLVYAGFGLFAPIVDNRFELSPTTLYVLRLTISIPYLVVWMAASLAAVKLTEYAKSIQGGAEEQGVKIIASGLYILLVGMIVPAIGGTVTSYYPESSDLLRIISISNNYLYVVYPLLAFGLLWWGTGSLVKTVGHKGYSPTTVFISSFILGLLTISLVFGIFTNPNRQIAPEGLNPSYYISDWLILVTLLIPQLIAWGLGLFSVAHVLAYARQVRGIVYRAFLSKLSWGLSAVIIASILLQGILSLGAERLFALGLGWLLVVIYVWLLVLVIGYVLIALGVRKLNSIENVSGEHEKHLSASS